MIIVRDLSLNIPVDFVALLRAGSAPSADGHWLPWSTREGGERAHKPRESADLVGHDVVAGLQLEVLVRALLLLLFGVTKGLLQQLQIAVNRLDLC